jgi:hypothetical protein
MKNHLTMGKMTAALIIVASALTLSAASKTVVYTVDDPRPLMEAARLLESKLGVQIDYEDAVIENPGELQDVASTVMREEHRKQNPTKRIFIPKGGRLDVSYEVNDQGRGINPESAIQRAVASHNAKGYPGHFTVDAGTGTFRIVPDRITDAQGQQKAHLSVFGAKVSFPEAPRTGLETIALILTQVKAITGQTVEIGMVPTNALIGTAVSMGATNEPAREVINRAFRLMKWLSPIDAPVPKISYDLLYDPDGRIYVFNAHVVTTVAPSPFGGTTIVPL